jgi:hypothetical protein
MKRVIMGFRNNAQFRKRNKVDSTESTQTQNKGNIMNKEITGIDANLPDGVVKELYKRIDKYIEYLPEDERYFAKQLIIWISGDNSGTSSVNTAIIEKRSMFMIFMAIGKRKQFNVDSDPKYIMLYKKYQTHMEVKYSLQIPSWQELSDFYSYPAMTADIFKVEIKKHDDDIQRFVKASQVEKEINDVPDAVSFIPTQTDVDRLGKVKDRVVKNISENYEKCIEAAVDLDMDTFGFMKPVIEEFKGDKGTMNTFLKALDNKNPLKLFEAATKRKPKSEKLKTILEQYVEFIDDMKKTDEAAAHTATDEVAVDVFKVFNDASKSQCHTTPDVGATRGDTQKVPFVAKELLMLNKVEIVQHIDQMMLKIINDTVSTFGVEFESFNDYENEIFNEAIVSLKKRHQFEIYGRCQSLREMIALLDIYVNRRGHNMLSHVIETYEA